MGSRAGADGVGLVKGHNPPLHETAAAERFLYFGWLLARPRPVNGRHVIPLKARRWKGGEVAGSTPARRQACG